MSATASISRFPIRVLVFFYRIENSLSAYRTTASQATVVNLSENCVKRKSHRAGTRWLQFFDDDVVVV